MPGRARHRKSVRRALGDPNKPELIDRLYFINRLWYKGVFTRRAQPHARKASSGSFRELYFLFRIIDIHILEQQVFDLGVIH